MERCAVIVPSTGQQCEHQAVDWQAVPLDDGLRILIGLCSAHIVCGLAAQERVLGVYP